MFGDFTVSFEGGIWLQMESEKEVLEGTVSQLESHLADAQKQSGASERLEGELAGKAELVARLEHDLNSLQGQVAGKDAMFEGLQAELNSIRKERTDQEAAQEAEASAELGAELRRGAHLSTGCAKL